MRRLPAIRRSSTTTTITRPTPAASLPAYATTYADRSPDRVADPSSARSPLARRFEVATKLLGPIEQARRVSLHQVRRNEEQVVAHDRRQLRPASPHIEPG